jgi:hypothetical protein
VTDLPAFGEKPNLAAIMAPKPEIMAIPTARTCDSEDTDPMTSSGDGMAWAAIGRDEKRDETTTSCDV